MVEKAKNLISRHDTLGYRLKKNKGFLVGLAGVLVALGIGIAQMSLPGTSDNTDQAELIENLETQIATLQSQTQETTTLQNEITRLTTALAQVETQRQADIEAAKAELTRLKTEHDAEILPLTIDSDLRELEITQLTETLSELEKKQQTERENAAKELARLKTELETRTTKLSKALAEIERLQKELPAKAQVPEVEDPAKAVLPHCPTENGADGLKIAGKCFDLAAVSINLTGSTLTDLPDFFRFSNLQRLYLTNTQTSDITPLANLTALQTLFLRNTQISNVTPLANLTALQFLDLKITQISDITPLANLTTLRALDLQGTQISDLSPIKRLEKLRLLVRPDGTFLGGPEDTAENLKEVQDWIAANL